METYDKKKDEFHIFVNQLKKLLKKSIEEGQFPIIYIH